MSVAASEDVLLESSKEASGSPVASKALIHRTRRPTPVVMSSAVRSSWATTRPVRASRCGPGHGARPRCPGADRPVGSVERTEAKTNGSVAVCRSRHGGHDGEPGDNARSCTSTSSASRWESHKWGSTLARQVHPPQLGTCVDQTTVEQASANPVQVGVRCSL